MGTEQMNRATSGTDGIARQEQAAALAQAMSALKLAAYASAQMQLRTA